MAKYGKWIGGGLGWVLGGPIGGIAGFIFGSMFDSMQSGKYEQKVTQPGDFSVSLLVLSAAMMKADGKVLKSELDFVKQFLFRQFGKEKAEQLTLMLRGLLKQNINVRDVSLQIGHHMEYSSKLQLLHYLFGIALADGQTHPREIAMIEVISNYLGISFSDLQSIQAMFVKDPSSAYKILEITSDATDEELKRAYRKMANKYHPDKVSHLGVDIKKAAKEKFQQLNEAYNEIKKQRGIK